MAAIDVASCRDVVVSRMTCPSQRALALVRSLLAARLGVDGPLDRSNPRRLC
jgi:hypothetical protein